MDSSTLELSPSPFVYPPGSDVFSNLPNNPLDKEFLLFILKMHPPYSTPNSILTSIVSC